ncbi:MAG: DNA repair protein RecN [Alphaproteobacteria bacterium]|nr:DNA repair protein RecN [Alphaproteobacteria bacterium]
MLLHLRVRALAILDDVTLELGPGLQIVTGETGAGKSILVDALQLVLGARAAAGLVRAGADEAIVEALFDLTGAPEVRARLTELTGTDEAELVVRRTVRAGGGSRATLNGHLATAGQLSRIVAPLVDICSQHEHHALADPATHLGTLDAFAGLDVQVEEMTAHWLRHQEAAAAVEALSERLRARAEREAVLRLQLQELDEAAPVPDEDVELEAEHGRLAHADRLAGSTRTAERVLYADDDAVGDRLARVCSDLDDLRGVDPELDALVDQLVEARDALAAVARELGRYARNVHEDPRRLATVEDRLALLRRLARRHGGSHDALVARHASLRQELAELQLGDARLEELEGERQAAADGAVASARALSRARQAAAAALGAAITAQLADLGMGDARVDVEVARLERRADELSADGARVGRTGMNRVTLLIAPNRGEPPRPLQRIASGGELSRAMLAVKRVLATRAPRGLHVFDEVDSGVGGAVAAAIGAKLAEVAVDRQVLCITHLAPIAAWADAHHHVRKAERDGRTTTEVHTLDAAGQVEELARMMGGRTVTDATRAAAAVLVSQAREGRPRA